MAKENIGKYDQGKKWQRKNSKHKNCFALYFNRSLGKVWKTIENIEIDRKAYFPCFSDICYFQNIYLEIFFTKTTFSKGQISPRKSDKDSKISQDIS